VTADSANVRELLAWMQSVSKPEWLWDVKFISANDTYAKPNVHQGGPYVSKDLLTAAFGVLSARAQKEENPDLRLPAAIDSHDWSGEVRLVWYNSKVLENRANGRDEARLTGWGGRESPLLEPNATGTLAAFAYRLREGRDAEVCRIWLCRDADESDTVLDRVGDVEPGRGLLFRPAGGLALEHARGPCSLAASDVPKEWIAEFPTGEQILSWVLRERPLRALDADDRLLKRRDCEYDLFLSIESLHVLPRVRKGFHSVDDFVDFASGVLNRRKSRSGRSLELHTRFILDEETVTYTHAPRTEGKRKPDLIFPDIRRYRDSTWPDAKLRMLALKTTCKDRWRQVLNEAARIRTKHLMTLQEGVSADQHKEMEEEGVVLVVPKKLMRFFPDEVKPKLLTLEGFIAEARSLT
jgi:hypothetical protein